MRYFKIFAFMSEKKRKAGSVSELVSSAVHRIAWKIYLQQWMRPKAQPDFCKQGGGLIQK